MHLYTRYLHDVCIEFKKCNEINYKQLNTYLKNTQKIKRIHVNNLITGLSFESLSEAITRRYI